MKRQNVSNIELKELKGKIKASDYSRLVDFAPRIPITVSTLSKKLNGKADFTTTEICRACKELHIPKEEILKYFFPHMFHNETNST